MSRTTVKRTTATNSFAARRATGLRRHAGWVFACLSCVISTPALAMEVIYDLERDPALLECDQQLYQGKQLEAQRCFALLMQQNTSPLVRAEAAWRLEDVKSANQLFREALLADPENLNIKVRWGHLFLYTHQDSEAMGLFREALDANENFIPAKLGVAKILAKNYDARAEELATEILAQDIRRVEALLLTAGMQLEEGDIESANKTLDRFLERAADRGLPLLEGWALKASAQLLEDKLTPEQLDDNQWVKKALAYNPAYGEIFEVASHFYIITYRYRETVAVLRKAVALQPNLWTAHSELGVNLLRVNLIDQARQHLEIAYAGDPFSLKTVNTLRLVDSLDEFEITQHVFRYPVPDNLRVESTEAYHNAEIILKLHRSEAQALRPFVLELTQQAIEAFSAHYHFLPQEPIVVELFPNHDDFAVRTVSVPGVGLLGVTFGYLLAMDSPSAKPQGDYHWGEVLWHELSHVFTIEASNHQVPRWFSEGTSVYEQWTSGPVRGVKIPHSVLESIAEDKLLSVADLDQGFVRPEYDGQVMTSYMQAGLICQYIDQNWSFDHLVRILEAFRDGKDTTEAIESVLQVSAGTFDSGFDAHVDTKLGSLLTQLKEFKNLVKSGHEAVKEEDWPLVKNYADQAIAIFPDYSEADSPYLLAAKAAEELGEETRALEMLEQFFSIGGWQPQALHKLAAKLSDAGRQDQAIKVLESLHYADPLDQDLHLELGGLYLQHDEGAKALQSYQVLLALQPHNLADAHYGLARSYNQLGNDELTRRHLLLALEAAPHFREAQRLLLEITKKNRDHE